MKELIVIVASVLLGLAIFGMIAGEQDGSVKSTLKKVWTNEVKSRSYEAY